jgi:hypothetical protein
VAYASYSLTIEFYMACHTSLQIALIWRR